MNWFEAALPAAADKGFARFRSYIPNLINGGHCEDFVLSDRNHLENRGRILITTGHLTVNYYRLSINLFLEIAEVLY